MAFDVEGFFYGGAGSAMHERAPTTGDAYAFPGSLAHTWDAIKKIGDNSVFPQHGTYANKFLTVGGGATVWDDDVYAEVGDQLAAIKAGGWTGVCLDREEVSSGHTTAGFNGLAEKVKAMGLLYTVTPTAEGPWKWLADKDATGIDWGSVDYLTPQLYDGAGKAYPQLDQYVEYWLNGGSRSVVSGVTFTAPPAGKMLSACPKGTVAHLRATYPTTAGYIVWDYDPNSNT